MKRSFKNIFSAVLLCFFFLVGTSSCDFGSLNIDPDNPSSAPNTLTTVSMQTQAAFNIGAMGGRMPGIVMQHFEGFDAQQVAYTSYVIEDITFDNFWNTGIFAGVLRDCSIIIETSTEEGNPWYTGIAQIMMAHNLGLATTFFGDIPFTEAFLGVDNLTPAYDDQASIYATIQSLLDQGIVNLSVAPYTQPAPPGNADIIYGGDPALWIELAQALKARFAMHLSMKSGFNAAAVLNDLPATFTEPNVAFGSGANERNPWLAFSQDRSNTLILAESFASSLEANSDPRAPFIFGRTADGVPQFDAAGTYWPQINVGIPIMSVEEVELLRAEAIVRSGGSDADAIAAMVAAVTFNMNKLGVTDQAVIDTYIAARVNFDGLTTTDEKIQRIIEEKYVALYGQAEAEVWVDYRRTGFPAITPNAQGDNGFNPGGDIPKRFIYPAAERSTNLDNLTAAISRQGGELMNVALWAFQP